MIPTDQPEPVPDAPDSSSGEKTPGTPKDAQAVPVGEHIEMRQKLRAAEAKLAEMEARLSAKDEPRKQATAQPSDAGIGETVKKLHRRAQIRDLTDELGLASAAQGEAVQDLLDKNPGLDPFEAVTIATKRDPKLFPGDQTDGYQPGIHGSMRPRSGSPPPDSEPKKSEFEQMTDAIKAATNKQDRIRLHNNLVGHLAAKAVGRPHTLLIPKK